MICSFLGICDEWRRWKWTFQISGCSEIGRVGALYICTRLIWDNPEIVERFLRGYLLVYDIDQGQLRKEAPFKFTRLIWHSLILVERLLRDYESDLRWILVSR